RSGGQLGERRFSTSPAWSRTSRLSAPDQRATQQERIARVLADPAHAIRPPRAAERHVEPPRVALGPQPPLALPMGAVEELELKPVFSHAHPAGELGEPSDEPVVVGGEDRVQVRLARRRAEYR